MMHPAELFCRKALGRYPRAREQEQYFLRKRADFGDKWPEWCGLPMAATYAMITAGSDTARKAYDTIAPQIDQLPDITAALLWTRAKVVYRFDPDLAASLLSQNLAPSDTLPMELFFQLPHFCVYVDAPFVMAGHPQIGFFAWMEYDVNSTTPELRLLCLDKFARRISIPVIFTPGKNINDAIDALGASAALRSALVPDDTVLPPPEQDQPAAPEEIVAVLQLLIYLCSDAPDVGESEALQKVSRRGCPQERTSRGLEIADVGYRIGAKLRAHARRDLAEPGQPTGAHNAPHIRRAHWHSYWVGSRADAAQRRVIVKWLHPILVGAESADDLTTVVHPVG